MHRTVHHAPCTLPPANSIRTGGILPCANGVWSASLSSHGGGTPHLHLHLRLHLHLHLQMHGVDSDGAASTSADIGAHNWIILLYECTVNSCFITLSCNPLWSSLHNLPTYTFSHCHHRDPSAALSTSGLPVTSSSFSAHA
ncbi:hypothetical protein TcWFU_002958 [Taenia crassiceps]|uniref:Uncharacterized protein n=1 Tax=Taenia crassiceps TaxID=6207 RepID=A0ABR4Q7X1_9CEST